MKFVQKDMGEAAEASAQTRGVVADTLKLFGFLAAFVVVVFFVVSWGTDVVVMRISPETEARIFGALGTDFLAEGSVGAGERWRGVLERLAAHPEVPPLPYRLGVTDDPPEPNAFALPGGRILLTLALLEKLGNDEAAVAFVLAHELGHYRQRDHLRGLGRAVGMAVCLMALGGSGDFLPVARVITGSMQRTYSRAQEEGADRFAARLVYETYGSADGAEKLFQLLREMEDLPAWAYMLSTHPGHDSRIRAIRETVEELRKRDAGKS